MHWLITAHTHLMEQFTHKPLKWNVYSYPKRLCWIIWTINHGDVIFNPGPHVYFWSIYLITNRTELFNFQTTCIFWIIGIITHRLALLTLRNTRLYWYILIVTNKMVPFMTPQNLLYPKQTSLIFQKQCPPTEPEKNRNQDFKR